jgi:hypothetical protein
MSAAEIHHELCVAVYILNVMSEGTVKTMVWNVHCKEQSGWPSVVNDDLIQSVYQKLVKDGASKFQNSRVNFHKFHALFSIRLSQLG